MCKKVFHSLRVLLCIGLMVIWGCGGPTKANLKLEQKDYESAIILYQEYLDKTPDSIEARKKLGFAYMKMNFLEEAISEFEKVLELECDESYSKLYLGLSYLSKGEISKAINMLETYTNSREPLVEEEVYNQLERLKTIASESMTEEEGKSEAEQFEKSVHHARLKQKEADQHAANMSEEREDNGGGCFAYDTKVLMADQSLKRIIDLRVNDKIKAFNIETQKIVARTVSKTYRADQDHYYLINGELKITETHPVFTLEGKWVQASDLKPGNQIASIQGSIEITSIKRVKHNHRVYNFRVENSHNYFVSGNGKNFYLVHN